jgi:hypothetical protein
MSQTNLTRYREGLFKLIALGDEMLNDLLAIRNRKSKKDPMGSFWINYQSWYTETSELLRQLLPDRTEEFESFYRPDPKRKNLTATNYTIQDWLSGIGPVTNHLGEKDFEEHSVVFMRYQIQLGILKSVEVRFESSLFGIRQLVQADLFDSELDAARELLKSGFVRGAGAVAGVVLEKHLLQVCINHGTPIQKQHSTIADLNDQLKKEDVIEVPTWRFVQRLGDLRNYASHNKDREPTPDEMRELIDGTDKITKTVY